MVIGVTGLMISIENFPGRLLGDNAVYNETDLTEQEVIPVPAWLVDWDLPKNQPVKRMQLWRKVKEIKKRLNGHSLKYSSFSVIVTSSEEMAQEIFDSAKTLGAQSNMYEITGEFTLVRKYHPREE